MLGRFAASLPAGTALAAVTASDVEGWLDGTAAGPVGRRTYVHTLRVLFRWGVGRGLLERDVGAAVPLERVPRTFPKGLRPEEVDRLVAAVGAGGRGVEWLRDLVVVAVYTGLRRGGLGALTFDDVDLDGRRLLVRNTAAFGTKGGRDRAVPLAEAALGVLRRRYEGAGGDRAARVFTARGAPLTGDNETRRLKAYARRAGVPHATVHALRHTACSWLAMRGVPAPAIQRFAGHSSLAVTERYVHLSRDAYGAQILRAWEADVAGGGA